MTTEKIRKINYRLTLTGWTPTFFMVVASFFLIPSFSFAGTQKIRSFDLNPKNGKKMDGFVSVAPPVGKVGDDFSPVSVEPTFPLSLIASSPLHVVSQSIAKTSLNGEGTITYSGPSDPSVKAYVGQGELPDASGTAGLTELNQNGPTPFTFTGGKSLFLYYVTQAPAQLTLQDLFGDGHRTILALNVASDANEVTSSSPAPVGASSHSSRSDRADLSGEDSNSKPEKINSGNSRTNHCECDSNYGNQYHQMSRTGKNSMPQRSGYRTNSKQGSKYSYWNKNSGASRNTFSRNRSRALGQKR